MDILQGLIRDAKFWWAVWTLISAIVLYLAPGIPREIWAAAEALITVIITGLTIQTARREYRVRAMRRGKAAKK